MNKIDVRRPWSRAIRRFLASVASVGGLVGSALVRGGEGFRIDVRAGDPYSDHPHTVTIGGFN